MEIQPYGRNAKIHPKAQLEHLARIVRRVGWRQPIVVNQKGRIIVGHGRWATYEMDNTLGEPWVIDDTGKTVMGGPATTPLSEDDEEAYRIADNKVHEGGKWDMEILIPLLKEIAPPSFAITGFRESIRMETSAKDDYAPAPATEAKTKLGDLYQLGRHKLLCGDSTDPEVMKKLMNGQQADMIFTDPPYNVDYKGSGKNTSKGMQNDHMDDQIFLEFLNASFSALKPNVKKGGAVYVFHSHKTAHIFHRSLKYNGFIVDTQLIWNKPSAGMGMNDYRTKHEPFFYCYIDKDHNFYGDRTGTTVWNIPEDPAQALEWFKRDLVKQENGSGTLWTMRRANVNEYVHPTQKPTELPMRAMMNSSKKDDLVLDTFLGLGTTLIAAEKIERTCYGTEIDPIYADVIVKRYATWCEDPVILLNGVDVTKQWVE